MGSQRRVGSASAKNRDAVLDAAQQLMLEEGYAAVTSRNVARKVGLGYPTVFYYFRTMDDLFLALLERRTEAGLERQAAALASSEPLRALWEFKTDPEDAVLTTEFAALANHRQAVRTALARCASQLRNDEIAGLRAVIGREGADGWSDAVIAVLMAGASRLIVLEKSLGLRAGHAETLEFIQQRLRRIEQPDQPDVRHLRAAPGRVSRPPEDDVDAGAMHSLLSDGPW